MSDEMKALVQEQFATLRSERDALRAENGRLKEALEEISDVPAVVECLPDVFDIARCAIAKAKGGAE